MTGDEFWQAWYPRSRLVVRMTMVNIREMRMRMGHGLMPMSVRVGSRIGDWRIVGIVLVPVMLIVDVSVFMRKLFVAVVVLVALSEMQPYAESHESRGDNESRRRALAVDDERQGSPDEWSGREVRTGSRGSEMPEREHEQHQA